MENTADRGQDAHADTPDPRLVGSVPLAREAAGDEAGPEQVGDHVGTEPEDGAVTHLFAAELAGYRGWRWAVTVAHGGAADTPVTVSEIVLLPGPDALVGRAWVPWSERVQAGDLGVGDVVLTPADDERLVPGYLDSGDTMVDEVNDEVGLGRSRVLSREGRLEAAQRWKAGEFGPRSDMARGAAGRCGTCGFYVQLGGTLRAAFGACGNEISPADGRVVHAEYGCGAHSETEVDTAPIVPVAGLVYDDAELDVESTASAPDAGAEDSPPEAEGAREVGEVPTDADTSPAPAVAGPTQDGTTGVDEPVEPAAGGVSGTVPDLVADGERASGPVTEVDPGSVWADAVPDEVASSTPVETAAEPRPSGVDSQPDVPTMDAPRDVTADDVPVAPVEPVVVANSGSAARDTDLESTVDNGERQDTVDETGQQQTER